MTTFEIIALLLVLAAGLSYCNHRFLGLPTTIGLMLISLFLSLGLILLGRFGTGAEVAAREFLNRIDFNKALMEGMLSAFLFAGALHININDLAQQKRVISLCATLGVVGSTFFIGALVYYCLPLLGLHVSFIEGLLFGALISPTDPVAVLGILKKARVPKSLETKIAGESLFNDGVGVVVFLTLLHIATGEHHATVGDIATLFLKETVGGAAFGLAIGWLAYRLLQSVDNYQVEILMSLALVTGGYALASALHLSAPIAIVVAGLLIGNHGRRLAMSATTREHLDTFWELIDEILNAVLFVLIGLEILVIQLSGPFLLAGLMAIPIVLLARFTTVGGAVALLRRSRSFSPGVVRILTWAGLRGGISIALALALPEGPARDLTLTMTYCVVIFSIVVQGLTIGTVVKRFETDASS
jgi:CPA1 family monovalent cation:H+ antiporter